MNRFSFVHVSALGHDLVIAAAVDEDLEERDLCHAIILEFRDGEWGHWSVNTRLIGLHASSTGGREVTVGVGFAGEVVRRVDGRQVHGRIGTGADMPSTLRRMTSLRRIGDRLYAAGMARQVFGSAAPTFETWQREDAGAIVPPGHLELNGFTSIDGFSADEIYACGLEGHLWWRMNGVWARLAFPTNITLSLVRCLPCGRVLVGGAAGVLFVGREDRWRSIENTCTRDGFVAAEGFGGRIYLASQVGELFELQAEDLAPFALPFDPKPRVYSFSSTDSLMVAAGGPDLLMLQDGVWSRTRGPFP